MSVSRGRRTDNRETARKPSVRSLGGRLAPPKGDVQRALSPVAAAVDEFSVLTWMWDMVQGHPQRYVNPTTRRVRLTLLAEDAARAFRSTNGQGNLPIEAFDGWAMDTDARLETSRAHGGASS